METTNVLIDFENKKLIVDNDGIDFIGADSEKMSVRCNNISGLDQSNGLGNGYLRIKGERVFHVYIWVREPSYYTRDELERTKFHDSAFDEPVERSCLEWTSRFPFVKKVTKQQRLLKSGMQRLKRTEMVDVKLPIAAYAIDDRRKSEVDTNA